MTDGKTNNLPVMRSLLPFLSHSLDVDVSADSVYKTNCEAVGKTRKTPIMMTKSEYHKGIIPVNILRFREGTERHSTRDLSNVTTLRTPRP